MRAGARRRPSSWVASRCSCWLFLFIESRQRHPLMPFSIFRLRTLRGANVIGLLLGMSLFSMFFFISLYMQQVLGYEPLEAGLAYLPLATLIILSAGAASQLVTRVGFKPTLIAGLLFVAAGLVWFGQVSPGGGYVSDVLFPSMLAAVGLGLAFVPVTIAAVTNVKPDEAGLASGLINTSQQVGGALGLAVLATVATGRTDNVFASGERNPAVALTEGFQDAFLVGAGMAILAALLAAVLISSKDSREHAEAAAAARPRRLRQRHRGRSSSARRCARPSWHACRNRPHAAPRRLRVLLRAAATIVGCFGEVAQLVEHTTENRGVAGSIPALAIQVTATGRSAARGLLRTRQADREPELRHQRKPARPARDSVACSGAESAARRADRGFVHGITWFTMSMSTASAAPTTRCALDLPRRGHVERAARALGAAAPETAYLDGPSSALLSVVPALFTTLRMKSYCVWTSPSAISMAASTISCRLDGRSPSAGASGRRCRRTWSPPRLRPAAPPRVT